MPDYFQLAGMVLADICQSSGGRLTDWELITLSLDKREGVVYFEAQFEVTFTDGSTDKMGGAWQMPIRFLEDQNTHPAAGNIIWDGVKKFIQVKEMEIKEKKNGHYQNETF